MQMQRAPPYTFKSHSNISICEMHCLLRYAEKQNEGYHGYISEVLSGTYYQRVMMLIQSGLSSFGSREVGFNSH